jgi:hypothetical protein
MQYETPSSLLPWLCRAVLIRSKANIGEEILGVPDRIARILRAPVGAVVQTGDYRFVVSAFIESLRTRSVFARLLDGGMTRIPLHTRAGVASSNATGWIVNEGKPKPLSQIVLSSQYLSPVKAVALVVVTEEMVRDISGPGQAFFSRELKSAISDVIDAKFFEVLSDSLSTGNIIPSAGNDAAAIRADLRAAMMAVPTGGNSALFWVMSSDVAKAASTVPEIFPAISPTGGEMCNLPALVGAPDPGTLMLIDASGIAGDIDNISVRASAQADVEMLDASLVQDAETGTGSTLVSMFQSDALALLAETYFGVEVLRTDAAAMITDIEWGA